MTLKSELTLKARPQKDHRGQNVLVIHDSDLLRTSANHGLPPRQVYIECMKMGIVPLRYLRNSPSITLDEQIILAGGCVAIVGAGGLGGHIIELLTRLGVGELRIFDPDCFDETNLNRQRFADQNTLGESKVHSARHYCQRINPGIEIVPHRIAITHTGQTPLFSDVRCIVDALDSAQGRLTLAAIAKKLTIPMIHGAVAGFEGRLLTVFPGDDSITNLYTDETKTVSAEHLMGTPALSPPLIASFQAMAVVDILLHRKQIEKPKIIHIDLNRPSLDLFSL
jgi:molybdopterin/thiamine biosynthesis adenylyltransferase